DDLEHIAAGAEIAAGPGQHDRAHVAGMSQVAEQVAQLGVRVEGEGVLALRPVQPHDRDAGVVARFPEKMACFVVLERTRVGIAHPAMTSPPATTIAWPLMDAEPGEASHSTVSATSFGVTSRPCGLAPAKVASASSSLRPVLCLMVSIDLRSSAVSVKPGQTAFTVMPVFANSSARERV